MGQVHVARDRDGRFVAIKKVRNTLSLDPALCERLATEAKILRRIDHPNVVRVLDGGVSAAGQPFVVMARAYGAQLDAAIASGPLARDRVRCITSQILDGLTAIHDAGVVHADVKSSNVLVNELDRVTIVDFGLSRMANAPVADDEIFGGTPAYMAPELLGGAAPTIASDIYAAGVVIYELLTGTTPMPRAMPVVAMMACRASAPIEPPSRRAPQRNIPPALDAVIARALAASPADRFASARELATALTAALSTWTPVDESPTGYWVRMPTAANLAPTQRRATPVDEAERIIQRGLEGVHSLVAKRDTTGAIAALETALARLSPDDKTREIVPQAWRLESVLSALYASVGKRDHAGRYARLASQHAHRSGDPSAISRTANLLDRFGPVGRLARGSRPPARRTRR